MYSQQDHRWKRGQDLFEINTLNHYIGVKAIAQSELRGR